jgi:hypothetical protein
MAAAIRLVETPLPEERFEVVLKRINGVSDVEAKRSPRVGSGIPHTATRATEAVARSRAEAISSAVVHTCDRPDALRRAVSSYLENFRTHGRAPDLVVMDDSGAPEIRRANREVLQQFRSTSTSRLVYAGRDEKSRFAWLRASCTSACSAPKRGG